MLSSPDEDTFRYILGTVTDVGEVCHPLLDGEEYVITVSVADDEVLTLKDDFGWEMYEDESDKDGSE
jgi:hypothetical protein